MRVVLNVLKFSDQGMFYRRRSGGAISLKMHSNIIEVSPIVPDIVSLNWFCWVSIRWVCWLLTYYATGYTKPSTESRKIEAVGPQVVPQSFYSILLRVLSFAAVFYNFSSNVGVDIDYVWVVFGLNIFAVFHLPSYYSNGRQTLPYL